MEIPFVSLILSLNSLTKNIILLVLIISEILFSMITYYVYCLDKTRIQSKQKGLPKGVLLLFPWLMGGLGGLMSIYVKRCKTHLWYFPMNNVLALVVQISLFIGLFILL